MVLGWDLALRDIADSSALICRTLSQNRSRLCKRGLLESHGPRALRVTSRQRVRKEVTSTGEDASIQR